MSNNKFRNTKKIDINMDEFISAAKELVDENSWLDDIPEEDIAVNIKNVSKLYKIYKKSWYRILNAFKKVKYKEFYALKNLSVIIPKGEAIGILGTNGSGKSTLLKMITGVAKPSEGEIDVHGRIAAMLELTSGFDRELTGYENIFLKATTLGISESEMKSKLDDIAAFADIGDYLYQPVRTYSSGMKSRLGFAINVNVNPDILIVDEVLAVGDDTFKLKCLSKMEEFRKLGKTILFVSHSLFTIKGFCTKAMWIKDGELIVKGDTATVVKIYENYLKEIRRLKKIRTEEEKKNEEEILSKSDILEIQNFKFLDPNISTKRRRKFDFNEPITLEIEYEIKQKMDNSLICCFSIRDSADIEIFSTDKQNPNNEIDNGIGRHVVRFNLKDLRLLPGTYKVAGEIWNVEAGMHFKFAKERTFIISSKKYLGGGVCAIPYNIEVDQKTLEERESNRPIRKTKKEE